MNKARDLISIHLMMANYGSGDKELDNDDYTSNQIDIYD